MNIPLVNIVVAIYKPNMIFLQKQLKSLNEQDYPNIEITFCDDSNDDTVHEEISDLIHQEITNFHYIIYKNEENLGSNKTFEFLTKISNSEYISYCDQDDYWNQNKISRLLEIILRESCEIAYSNLAIINEFDQITAKSFLEVNKRVEHKYGEKLFSYFLERNSITGCTMLMKTSVAKRALPFSNDYVHDHWLALYGSYIGNIAYTPETLINYRIHANNQIGASVLKNINSRKDYLAKLAKISERYSRLLIDYDWDETARNAINYKQNNLEIRINLLRNLSIRSLYIYVKTMKDDFALVALEVSVAVLPKNLLKYILNYVRKG